jgi:hypothetical protein
MREQNKGVTNKNEIAVLRSIEEIEGIRDDWEKMQWHYRGDIDYYLTEIRMDSRDKGIIRPHVIVLKRDRQPVSLMVGRIQEGNIRFRIGYKDIYRPKVSEMVNLSGGLIGDTSLENAEIIINELIETLYRREADVVHLNPVRSDSPIYKMAREMPRILSRDHFSVMSIHRRLTLPETVNEFYERLSGNTRESIRRYVRKLTKRFGENLYVKCYCEEKDLEIVMKDLDGVASKAWQRGLGVGFFNDDKHRSLMRLAAQRGWLRIYVLYLEGKPSAFWWGYLYKGTFYIDIPGYDPEYSAYKIGTYLMVKMIENLIQDGLTQKVDYGLGDAQYKRSFSDESWQDAYVYIFSPRLKGMKMNLVRSCILTIDKSARWVLNRTHLFDKIKRIWRRRLAERAGGSSRG